MSLINFESIRKLVGDEDDKHKDELFKETMLMVLARATRADSNVEQVEIDRVVEELKAQVGVDFSVADIKVAASSEVFESKSLERFLSSATKRLNESERATILASLANVIRSDEEIRHFELDFFDRVAMALRATPSEIAGLVAVD
jgi:uncharacterized tellurite resistance protein B-like protein